MPKPTVDLTGKKFGMLTVIDRGTGPAPKAYWNCICDCGGTSSVEAHALKVGKTTSCGCRRAEPSRLRHGHTAGNSRTPEHSTWTNMRKRCNDPNQPAFPDYGGRGIKVHEEWDESFEAFLAYMGRKPSPAHSIDRIDNNGNYEPGNVRWATPKEQANNRRPRDNKSGIPGVYWHKRDNKWQVRVDLPDGSKRYGGYFTDLEDAALTATNLRTAAALGSDTTNQEGTQ